MYLFYSISMRIHILKTKLSLKSLMWMRPETQFPNPVKSNGKLERWVNVLPWSLCIYFEFCFSRHTLWLNTFLTQISFFFSLTIFLFLTRTWQSVQARRQTKLARSDSTRSQRASLPGSPTTQMQALMSWEKWSRMTSGPILFSTTW